MVIFKPTSNLTIFLNAYLRKSDDFAGNIPSIPGYRTSPDDVRQHTEHTYTQICKKK